MSLLMDALKKAEKEKQEAANRKDETGPNPLLSSTSELPIDSVATESDLPDYEEDTHAYEELDDDSGLSLEPIDSLDSLSDDELPDTGTYPTVTEDVNDAVASDQEEQPFENTQELNRTDSMALSEFEKSMASPPESDSSDNLTYENTQTMENELSVLDTDDEPDDYIPVDAETSLRLEGFAEGDKETVEEDADEPELVDDLITTGNTSVSLNTDEMQYSSTKEKVNNEQFMEMLGTGARKPTPAAADTVFRASAQGKSWIKSGKGLGVLVVILLLSLGLGAVIFYWTTPQVYQMPTPSLAQGAIKEPALNAGLIPPVTNVVEAQTDNNDTFEETETSDVTDTVYVDHEADADLNSKTSAEDIYGPLVDESVADAVTEDAMGRSESVATVEKDGIAEESASAASTAMVTDKPDSSYTEESQVSASQIMDDMTDRTESQAVTEPVIRQSVSEEMIQITRAVKTANNENMNQQAYAAYQKGDYQVASILYNKVLKDRPDNRDALMGLAAIDVINQRPAEAYRRYRQILISRPDDIDARLAIINLKGLQKDNESLIKLMLQNQPDSAELYSSLGNIYAAQQRWAEAQQMFFEAFRRANSEADYALNLAVSLDQLGQARAARDYYQKALTLADASRTPAFDTQAILKRVQAISSEQ